MGSLSLLQGIFLTQESNWGLLHCRQIFLPAELPGKPFITRVSCIAGGFFTSWVTREALYHSLKKIKTKQKTAFIIAHETPCDQPQLPALSPWLTFLLPSFCANYTGLFVFLNIPNIFPPQDLCIYSSFCLYCSFLDYFSLFSFPQFLLLSNISMTQWFSLTTDLHYYAPPCPSSLTTFKPHAFFIFLLTLCTILHNICFVICKHVYWVFL